VPVVVRSARNIESIACPALFMILPIKGSDRDPAPDNTSNKIIEVRHQMEIVDFEIVSLRLVFMMNNIKKISAIKIKKTKQVAVVVTRADIIKKIENKNRK
jgi:hypothetical protein